MMEAVRTSETSVHNYFTRQYIPEDNSEHHTRRRENLKSHIVNLYGEATLRRIRRFDPFGSRKPSASAPYPSFCDAKTKAPFPASYNSIIVSTPRLPRGSTVGSSLMMEAVRTSETSVHNYFTRQYIPEDNSEQEIIAVYTEYHAKPTNTKCSVTGC
jgi:hypothetical protein